MRRITIWSDSKYFVEHLGLARFGWPNTGSTKAEGAPVDNVRQWKDLKRLWRDFHPPIGLVGGDGFEPPTPAL